MAYRQATFHRRDHRNNRQCQNSSSSMRLGCQMSAQLLQIVIEGCSKAVDKTSYLPGLGRLLDEFGVQTDKLRNERVPRGVIRVKIKERFRNQISKVPTGSRILDVSCRSSFLRPVSRYARYVWNVRRVSFAVIASSQMFPLKCVWNASFLS